MKYIIFVALLAYVAAVPNKSQLRTYVNKIHLEVDQLLESLLTAIPQVEEGKALEILSNHKTSFEELCNNFINTIPETDETLQEYKNTVISDLRNPMPYIFARDPEPELGPAQNVGKNIAQAAGQFIEVSTFTAELLIPNVNPGTAETLDLLAREAAQSAHKAVGDILLAFDNLVMKDEVIDKEGASSVLED